MSDPKPTAQPTNTQALNIQSATGGGVAALQQSLPVLDSLVAPASDTKGRNTIQLSVIPFACWRADDVRFEFDSSFLRPEISAEIAALKLLIDKHTLPNLQGIPTHKPTLSVFGHADPTGNDDYNKSLSGRRAQAMYGMLIRDVDLWENLFAHPQGRDNWDPAAIKAMESALGRPATDRPNSSARKALYKDYMDALCTVRDLNGNAVLGSDGKPEILILKKTDFLAAGLDPHGRGDFQGCGEFNPIRMFSAEENNEFSKPPNHAERDRQNAPNRRVLVFLFRPGVHVKPTAWPCPAAKDGVGACKKRFWSDADKRRSFQAKRREFKDTEDTFACRFYDRLSNKSPCERIVITFSVRLYDLERKFIPFAPFELTVGTSPPIRDRANADGVAIVPGIEIPNQVRIKWGFPPDSDQQAKALNSQQATPRPPRDPDQPEGLLFENDMFLDADSDDRQIEAQQKLHNLAYPQNNPFPDNVAAFQRDYGKLAKPPLRSSGVLDDATLKLLRDVHASSEDNLLNDEPERNS